MLLASTLVRLALISGLVGAWCQALLSRRKVSRSRGSIRLMCQQKICFVFCADYPGAGNGDYPLLKVVTPRPASVLITAPVMVFD